jgi:NAD(P)-dependent dehydrogenase (short-subunit alcohol dehydrogenase family)
VRRRNIRSVERRHSEDLGRGRKMKRIGAELPGVAIVTGSTRWIGAAIAARLARDGRPVVVTGRSAARGEAVVDQIARHGGTALFIPCDVTDEAAVAALVSAAEQRLGPVTALVNNAAPLDLMGAGGIDAPLHELSASDFERIVAVILKGTLACCREILPAMIKRRSGTIVNITSGAATAGMARVTAYTAAKGSISALTRQLAVQYGPHGITVNAVSPGYISAEVSGEVSVGMRAAQALPWPGSPDDIAGAVAYFCSPEARFVTGEELRVDGGMGIKLNVPDARTVANTATD